MTILSRPPKGFRPNSPPASVKRLVLERQGYRCAGTGEFIGEGGAEYEFDHRPAIWEREFDTEKNDTRPPAHDPEAIEAVTVPEHRRRSRIDEARQAKEARMNGETGHKSHRYQGLPMFENVANPIRHTEPKFKHRLRGRGFDKSRSRRLDGRVVKRKPKLNKQEHIHG